MLLYSWNFLGNHLSLTQEAIMSFQYAQIEQTFIVTALENTTYLFSKGWLSTDGEPRPLLYKTFLQKECSSLSDQVIKITEYEKKVAILALKAEPKTEYQIVLGNPPLKTQHFTKNVRVINVIST